MWIPIEIKISLCLEHESTSSLPKHRTPCKFAMKHLKDTIPSRHGHMNFNDRDLLRENSCRLQTQNRNGLKPSYR